MTTWPGVPDLNAPHMHQLGFFGATEEAYAEDGKTYTLHVINNGASDFTSLKALYYEVPNSTRKYWFAYTKTHNVQVPGMPTNMGIAVYSFGGETYFEGHIGVNSGTNIRTGLIFTLSNITSSAVTVNVKIDPTWVLTTASDPPMPSPDPNNDTVSLCNCAPMSF
jgi:hypothetical protein